MASRKFLWVEDILDASCISWVFYGALLLFLTMLCLVRSGSSHPVYTLQRLALTGTAVSTSHWSSAFTVAVYDETGMLYCGEYNTGQNCRPSSYGNYACVPKVNQMAELSWS